MNAQDYFSIKSVCELLSISRPTLNSYRKKFGIESITIRGRVYFRKLDILERFCFPAVSVTPTHSFTVVSDFAVEELEVAPGVFDLRQIRTIDAFGAICLMCCLKSRTERQEHVYLLTAADSASVYLQSISFFQELKRVDAEYIHYDSTPLNNITLSNAHIILPLHLIGYKGGEKSILNDIYASLREQGFSEELCSSLGWTLGELADNATTHANGSCYFMLSSMVGPRKYLTLTIGDIGVGIPVTLKSNEHFKSMDDLSAFVTAFKSDVSSWEDHHKRGKGLNDLLAIAKGNGAWVRTESNDMGLFFDFQKSENQARTRPAGTKAAGTRYSIVLIDSEFDYVTKREINTFLDDFMEQI